MIDDLFIDVAIDGLDHRALLQHRRVALLQ
jgi:hypothetical protein